MKENITQQYSSINRMQREHKGKVLWLTGLSGSGKSTLAFAVEKELHKQGLQTIVLDGDNLRQGLCKDLGFNEQDRKENSRRAAEVAKLLISNGTLVIVALISPYKADRQLARELVGSNDFIEIYCNCPLDICEQRDVKGLYQKVRQRNITNFTGIDSPYERPESVELVLDTAILSKAECVGKVLSFIEKL